MLNSAIIIKGSYAILKLDKDKWSLYWKRNTCNSVHYSNKQKHLLSNALTSIIIMHLKQHLFGSRIIFLTIAYLLLLLSTPTPPLSLWVDKNKPNMHISRQVRQVSKLIKICMDKSQPQIAPLPFLPHSLKPTPSRLCLLNCHYFPPIPLEMF